MGSRDFARLTMAEAGTIADRPVDREAEPPLREPAGRSLGRRGQRHAADRLVLSSAQQSRQSGPCSRRRGLPGQAPRPEISSGLAIEPGHRSEDHGRRSALTRRDDVAGLPLDPTRDSAWTRSPSSPLSSRTTACLPRTTARRGHRHRGRFRSCPNRTGREIATGPFPTHRIEDHDSPPVIPPARARGRPLDALSPRNRPGRGTNIRFTSPVAPVPPADRSVAAVDRGHARRGRGDLDGPFPQEDLVAAVAVQITQGRECPITRLQRCRAQTRAESLTERDRLPLVRCGTDLDAEHHVKRAVAIEVAEPLRKARSWRSHCPG